MTDHAELRHLRDTEREELYSPNSDAILAGLGVLATATGTLLMIRARKAHR